MSQTKQGSVVEAVANTTVGFLINFTANLLILPLFGFHDLTIGKNIVIGILYTLISLIRSYVLRRTFNRMHAFNTSDK